MPSDRRNSSDWRSSWTVYAMVVPKLVIFVLLLLSPILYTIYLAQLSGSLLGEPVSVGTANFERIVQDRVFWLSLRNTGIYALLVIPTTVTAAMMIAVLLATRPKGARLYTVALILPTVTPTVAAAIVWNNLLQGDAGLVNQILGMVGLERVLWLGNPRTVIPVIALVEFWRSLGFFVVIFLAAIQSLPKSLYEAGALDGIVGRRAFAQITLPLLRPIIVFATVMATIFSFQVFDTPFVMTQGGPGFASTMLVLYIYRTAFAFDNMGYAAAIAFVLMVIILVLSVIQLRLFRSNVQY